MILKLQQNNGFSLVELMLALGVFSIVMLGIVQTQVLFQRYWISGNKEIAYQSAGRTTMENMAKAFRRASNVTISDSINQTVANITDTTGTNLSYTYDKNNKLIRFDNDTSTANDSQNILFYVEVIGTEPVFKIQGDRVVAISYRVLDPETADGTQGRDFVMATFWRN